MDLRGEHRDSVTTILLDIGGVLYVDPWQTILLTPGSGLADRLGLPHQAVSAAADRLWPEFSTNETVEHDYWDRLLTSLGVRFDDVADVVEQCSNELLRPLPGAQVILSRLGADYELGVITDNTTFWYQRQHDALHLDECVNPKLIFVSSTERRSKDGQPSLFDHAATRLSCSSMWTRGPSSVASTLVVDDRQSKLDRAAEAGFRTLAASRLPEFIGDLGTEHSSS